MKQPNTRMMDRIAEIENCVLGGLVLDDRGNWVSIADKRASEEDFLVHLEAGRVLHIGQWVRFADAKTPPVAPVSASPDNGYPPETVVVGFSPAAAPGRPEAISREASEEEETSIGQYPPETKAIQIQPPVPGTEGANSDAVSSYTMETGLFVIDRSIEVAETQGLESGTKPAMAVQSTGSTAPAGKKTGAVPLLVHPSIPTWEKEETRQKKRTLIIGGIIVGVIGIAAIVVLVLQVLR